MQKRIVISLFVLLIMTVTSSPVKGADFFSAITKAGCASNDLYKGLNSYECLIKTSQFEVMRKKMTESFPADMPRPDKPLLKKYWQRGKGMVIVAEGKSSFPYMKEFSKRMSSQFALELCGYFLPAEAAQKREKLLKSSKTETDATDNTRIMTITFNAKQSIGSAFFRSGLPVPVDNVRSLVFYVDKKNDLVKAVEVYYDNAEGYKFFVINAEYGGFEKQNILTGLVFQANDASVKGDFRTEFKKIDKYFLPYKQIRTIEGKNIEDEQKKVEVEFTDYKLNKKIPKDIFKQ